MNETLVTEVATECATQSQREHAVIIDGDALRELVADILYGSRDLIGAFDDGIITLTEVASATADRVHAWVLRRYPQIKEEPGKVYPDPDPYVMRLADIIQRGVGK